MLWWIAGVVGGVLLAGYIYHRWYDKAKKVEDVVANTVNDVIDNKIK